MILGINGSPRKGNSFILLEKFLEGAKEAGKDILLIDACKLSISPCQECGYCMRKKVCRLDDNMKEYIELLCKCSHIAVSSPVFFFSISSQLKIFIDRCQPLWARKYIFNENLQDNFKFIRKGFFFSTGGFNKNITFKGGELVIKCFFDSLSVKFQEKLYVASMEDKNDIYKKEEFLELAYNFGKSIDE